MNEPGNFASRRRLAAFATIAAAIITAYKSRRDERSRILKDIDVTDKLADDKPVKALLQAHIRDRVTRLVIEIGIAPSLVRSARNST